MRVRVNGEDREVDAGTDIHGLLRLAGAPPDGVAVAVNGEVVARSEWDRVLRSDDRVEIIRAVGGG